MALSTRAVLRTVLATATFVALAGASAAQEVGGGAAPQDAYRGRFLDWAGKSPAPAAAPAPAPAPPEPSSDVAEATYVAPRPPTLETGPQRASPPSVVANAAPASYLPPPPTPPATERATPAPAVAPASPVSYMPPPTQPAAARAAPLAPAAPAHIAAATPAPAPNAYAASADTSQRVHVRFYSVDRPYGLTPDPIQMPTKRPMILVGPPDATASHSQDDAGDGDKSAAHDDGQGGADDPSGDN